MKVYLNTKAFDLYHSKLDVTRNMAEAELLVMGAKAVEIEKFIRLKAVFRFGIGADNVPFDYLKEKKVPVYFPSDTTKRLLFESTANFASYLIINMYYSPCIGNVAQWKKCTRDYIGEKTLLIIGMGNIGKRVFRKMKPFMTVKTFDLLTNKPSELESLIRQADYISLHIPMTSTNKNFIDREVTSWMKNNAVLVNTSRGQLVDEDALYESLLRTNMRAAFDVFWVEPYYGKLSKLPREKFFMTPHSSSQTRQFVEQSFSDILRIAKEA